jgi:hypothetical protein
MTTSPPYAQRPAVAAEAALKRELANASWFVAAPDKKTAWAAVDLAQSAFLFPRCRPNSATVF